MRIIISPAKKMRTDVDYPEPAGLPVFLEKSEYLLGVLRAMSYDQLKKLWACNDEIAGQNAERLRTMELRGKGGAQGGFGALAAALVSYDGIQYQYMAPQVFPDAYYDYVQEHLRILSGFYGIVKPLDAVTPYRLEMQARLQTDRARNLYEFWGDSLYRELTQDDHVILNLASYEYSKIIEKYLTSEDTFVTCIFGQMIDGRVREKGVYVKMARGEMVRYLAEIGARSPEDAKGFDRLGFTYREDLSDSDRYVFIMP